MIFRRCPSQTPIVLRVLPPPTLVSYILRTPIGRPQIRAVHSFSKMVEDKSNTGVQLVDIALNLTDPIFRGIYRGKRKHEDDMTDMLQRAEAAGVERMLVLGGSLKESKDALKLAREYGEDRLYSTVGVHPTRCDEFEKSGDPDEHLRQLLETAEEGMTDGKVVAIGECGLDYDRLQFCSKETQLKYFEMQFSLAEKTGLPMLLHCRNSADDFLDLIRKHRDRFTTGVVHSFTGTVAEMNRMLEQGLYIGINGCSMKSVEQLDVVKSLPLDRMMLETDAPWCEIRPTHAGHSHIKTTWPSRKADKYQKGSMVKSRNEPCTTLQVAEVVAGIRGEDLATVAQETHKATLKVFFSGKG